MISPHKVRRRIREGVQVKAEEGERSPPISDSLQAVPLELDTRVLSQGLAARLAVQ